MLHTCGSAGVIEYHREDRSILLLARAFPTDHVGIEPPEKPFLVPRAQSSMRVHERIVCWRHFPFRDLLADREGTLFRFLRESLTIAGWVAMWRPMQIYLYDWWPLRRRGQLYGKLSRIPVEVVRKD